MCGVGRRIHSSIISAALLHACRVCDCATLICRPIPSASHQTLCMSRLASSVQCNPSIPYNPCNPIDPSNIPISTRLIPDHGASNTSAMTYLPSDPGRCRSSCLLSCALPTRRRGYQNDGRAYHRKSKTKKRRQEMRSRVRFIDLSEASKHAAANSPIYPDRHSCLSIHVSPAAAPLCLCTGNAPCTCWNAGLNLLDGIHIANSACPQSLCSVYGFNLHDKY